MRPLLLAALLATSASAQVIDCAGPCRITVTPLTVTPTPSPTPTSVPTSTPSPTPSPAPTSSSKPMTPGINIAPPSYYGQERAFMNLLAGGGRQLITATGQYTSAIPSSYLNASNDIVTMAAKERITRAISVPTAAYQGASVPIVCTWAGKTSKVEIWGGGATGQKYAVNSATFTFKGTAPVSFIYTGTDAADPMRQIDCREVGADPGATFDPTFLASLKPYSVLRFMDWQSTNNNSAQPWALRNRPGNGLVKANDGVALDYIVELANLTGKSIWINVPWNYSAADVQAMATFFRDGLKPGIVVHVEVSNEVWNALFPVTTQAHKEGVAAGLGPDSARPLTELLRYSQRTDEVMTIWTQVFAGQMNRLVRVAATQNSTYAVDQILKFGTTRSKLDAVAVAPYFGGGLPAGALATQAQIDTLLDVTLPKAQDTALGIALGVRKLALASGLRFIAYEGGQHVLSPDVAQLKLVERDPRMGALYTRYLAAWKAQFGDLLTLYSDVSPVTKDSSFGNREYPGQTDAVKANAIEAFVNANTGP